MVRRVFPNGKREVICSLWNMSLSVETSMKLVTAREAPPLMAYSIQRSHEFSFLPLLEGFW